MHEPLSETLENGRIFILIVRSVNEVVHDGVAGQQFILLRQRKADAERTVDNLSGRDGVLRDRLGVFFTTARFMGKGTTNMSKACRHRTTE